MPQGSDFEGRDGELLGVPPLVDPAPDIEPAPASDPASRLARATPDPDRMSERARIRTRVRRAQAEMNERSGRDLLPAIGVGLGLGLLGVISLVFDKHWFVLFGVGLVGALVVELATAMRASGRHVPRIPSALVVACVVPGSFYFGPAWLWAAILAGVAFVVVWRIVEALVTREPLLRRELAVDASSAAFVQFYATFLGSFTTLLAAQPRGEFWVLTFIIIVVCVDTGAYVFGMRFGRTKLAPRISPGKTWEGIVGGVLAAVVAGILAAVFILELPWWFGIVLGVALTVTAVAGDLTESMVKRDLRLKDMSNWLPGHGGVFDRLDSMLPSGAMAFALYFVATPLMHLAGRLA